MVRTFDDHGVRFRYPQQWELQQEPSESGVTISVNSPGTSFWSLTLDSDGPDPQALLQAAVNVFREEYQELDSYPVNAQICHRAALGRDLEFVCLDMLNSACLRVFRTGRFTALILYQGYDSELAETRPAMDAITASLECEGDEHLFGASETGNG